MEGGALRELVNEIHCGNCADFMRHKLQPECIDLTVTSPPYDNLRDYRGYRFGFEEVARALYRVTKPGGVVVWVIGDKIGRNGAGARAPAQGGKSLTSFRQGLFFQELGFRMHDVMIYQKKNTPFMRRNAYTNCYEFMFVLSKGAPATFNPLRVKTARSGFEMLVHNKGPDGINKKTRAELKREKTKNNVWQYAVGLGGTTKDRIAFQHPAVFPEQLAADHILSWTNPGDVVFDPMCGSGTTCKMAHMHRRVWLGVDVSEEYVAIARQRLQAAGAKLNGVCT